MNKFTRSILIAGLLIFILIISFISYVNYRSIHNILGDNFINIQQLVEDDLTQIIKNVNNTYSIAEQQLNQEMEEYSQLMLEKYRENPDVESWDLQALKEKMDDYEIYIINQDLEVIRTTFSNDLGLDFSQYSSFARVLRKRMKGDEFVVDRLDLSTTGGDIKKYSYMPTPDNRYLLELSIEVQERYPILENMNIYKDASELTEEYDQVEDISFYSVEMENMGVAKLRKDKKPFLDPDVPELEEKLSVEAIKQESVQKKVLKKNGYNVTKKFFPALISSSEDDQQWHSYVAGITYSDKVLLQEVRRNRDLFIVNGFIMVLAVLIFVIIVYYLLKKFEYIAYHDQLTDLLNRKAFLEKINDLIKDQPKKRRQTCIAFLDIDKFKDINDKYGHTTGDMVIKKVSSRLKEGLRKNDLLARMGGDEFIIAFSDISTRDEIINVIERIVKNFKNPLHIEEKEIEINISLGISVYPENGRDIEDLMKKADEAMYVAKRENKDFVLA
ncbi:MAG: GGDEF domain-containing protein [Bacillota bacterium]